MVDQKELQTVTTLESNIPISERIAYYLKQAYARLIIPESDGTFRGEVLELPGCIATGDTPTEALLALEEAAKDWLEVAIEHGQNIPSPVDNTEFSGRLVLRLPKSLHKKASRMAERDGVSLNQFIVFSLAEQVGERAVSRTTMTFNTLSNHTSTLQQKFLNYYQTLGTRSNYVLDKPLSVITSIDQSPLLITVSQSKIG